MLGNRCSKNTRRLMKIAALWAASRYQKTLSFVVCIYHLRRGGRSVCLFVVRLFDQCGSKAIAIRRA
jgi:hypothetical protein